MEGVEVQQQTNQDLDRISAVSNSPFVAPAAASPTVNAATSLPNTRATRSTHGPRSSLSSSSTNEPALVTPTAANVRRSARLSLSSQLEQVGSGGSDRKGKSRAFSDELDRGNTASGLDISLASAFSKGKKRESSGSDPGAASSITGSRESKRLKASATTPAEKGKAKASLIREGKMPKKGTVKPKKTLQGGSAVDRSKKGDSAAKHLIGHSMLEDEENAWHDEPVGSSSRDPLEMGDEDNQELGGDEDEGHLDDDEGHTGEEEEDDGENEEEAASASGPTGGAAAAGPGASGSGARGLPDWRRFAQLAGAGDLDEAAAAALFGGSEFRRSFGFIGGGSSSNRWRQLKSQLKSPTASTRLAALKECSEKLLVSNEETLGAAFSTSAFGAEFIAILKGEPNIDENAPKDPIPLAAEDMDEDAQLAAVLAMSAGEAVPGGMPTEDEMETQLVACRCLAHLMEALPGSGHTLVHLGAVPVLCGKLHEISYIELAEQVLSTLEKISQEYPSAIAKHHGLAALVQYLDFFSTNVQRTAVTAAANCCRNISNEHYAQIKEIFPVLRETMTKTDQRLVEQATLAVVRTLEAYRNNASHLEGLLDVPMVVAINSLLMPAGGSPLLSSPTYTHLLRVLTSSARGSVKVTLALLEAGVTNTVYQILTGVLPSSHDEDEQGNAAGGQGLAGGVADMVVLQNLAHRPKDQVEESLALISELLPPLPRDGVFDSKAYTEKAIQRAKKGITPSDRVTRRASRQGKSAEGSGASTPAEGVSGATAIPASDVDRVEQTAADATPTTGSSTSVKEAIAKARREAEAAAEQRHEALRARPELLGKLVKAMVPVLVDVYAASVASRVRSKVLLGLVKAVAFAETDDLTGILKNVPMASFLGAIISTRDNPAFVNSALQIVELLTLKLPDVYQTSFQREGIVYEIEALARQDLSTAKAKTSDDAAGTGETKLDTSTPNPGPSSSRLPAGLFGSSFSFPDELEPMFAGNGLSSILLDREAIMASAVAKAKSSVDPQDANILRARMLGVRKLFDNKGDSKQTAEQILGELNTLVARLIDPSSSESELRVALSDVAGRFSSMGQALSSFELLRSGLVDGLLEFVDIDGTVSSADRRAMLYDTFTDTSIASPSPATMLIKRLHESLGRLESFEVESVNTASDYSRHSGSSLGRSMRIRLQPEEGQDISKAVSNIVINIQAIAPLRSLHDYLRPKVASGSLGSSDLAGMLNSFSTGGLAIPGGSGSSAARLLSALQAQAASRGQAGSTEASGTVVTASAPEFFRSSLPQPAETSPASADALGAPKRRRSARLSGRGTGGDTTAEDAAESSPVETAAVLSSSAPESGSLGGIPMDMDYDDGDYTDDDDYDAEVFEEDMEQELAQPREKVVNMNVADDGSRVEAKTPEGTRIATPNPSVSRPGPAVGPAASGSGTPRTASYAGAVKTEPSDWHLAFTLDGNALSLDDTIFGAVHKWQKAHPAPGNQGNVFGIPLTFKFKKVNGPLPAKSSASAVIPASPATVASVLPDAMDPETSTTKILRLLRVLFGLATEHHGFVPSERELEDSLFVNNKLTAKLARQLEEVMILASNCLPEWANELPRHFSFLFPFETRYSYLQNTSFGYRRLIARYVNAQSSNNRRDELMPLNRIIRQKCRISRTQILESAMRVMDLFGAIDGILEIEYFDEIGTGLGPTLEFFALVSKELCRRSLGVWRDEDETKEGDYVYHPHGLFPAPIKDDSPAGGMTSLSRLTLFKHLGTFVARALIDSRIIDFHFNKVFMRLILGKRVKKNIVTLRMVDAALARSLERLQSYLDTRKEIEALKLPASARRSKLAMLTVGGAKLADLSLDFTLPGYNIELKPGGALIDVDDSNLEEYLAAVLEMTLGSGVAQQVKAFQDGFSQLYPIQDMQIFSTEEINVLCGNADEDWSRETLEQALKADHGYNLDSRSVQNLIATMSSYDQNARRRFLQFITGAPKLPIGGFRGLNPPFTVVRKPHEQPFKADDYLPSVMTCAQYLKLPDYSTREVLEAQIQRAMTDGGGSFHLS